MANATTSIPRAAEGTPGRTRARRRAGATPGGAAPRPPSGADASFDPIKRRRISEEISAQVRKQIAAGKLTPGDRLPSERELASAFGVSRMAVREGMRNLEVAGLVTLRKGRYGGAFIADNGVRIVSQSMQDMIDLGRASLEMLMEVRQHMMDVVVRLACVRATQADFDALEKNIDRTEELTREGRFEERTFAAIEFNNLLAEATGNYIFRTMVESLSVVLRHWVALAGIRKHDPVIASRRKLLEQLRKRQKEAAAATMRVYLEELNEHLVRSRREQLARGAAATPAG